MKAHLVSLGLALIALAAVSPANAHDWYSGKRDPVTGGSCCFTARSDGYGDCAKMVVEPGMLEGVPEGYRLRLTLEQARRFNPLRTAPVDTLIPWERMQVSEDGNFHLCIPPRADGLRFDFYCFWQPGAS